MGRLWLGYRFWKLLGSLFFLSLSVFCWKIIEEAVLDQAILK
jgi:hypothetical protein